MPWLRLLRPHHWAKNVLLGVPYLTAQAWQQPGAALQLGLAILAFSLVASATYILNDLADVAFDRAHAVKKSRPLAAGTVQPAAALAFAALLAMAGLALAWRVGASFTVVLLAYVAVTTLYTRILKRRALLDVLALAALWVRLRAKRPKCQPSRKDARAVIRHGHRRGPAVRLHRSAGA